MSDEQEIEEEIEFVPECEVTLHDGQCWMLDPAYLHHDADVEGVVAVQYTVERGLWYLDGQTRQWVKADVKPGKPSLTRVQ